VPSQGCGPHSAAVHHLTARRRVDRLTAPRFPAACQGGLLAGGRRSLGTSAQQGLGNSPMLQRGPQVVRKRCLNLARHSEPKPVKLILVRSEIAIQLTLHRLRLTRSRACPATLAAVISPRTWLSKPQICLHLNQTNHQILAGMPRARYRRGVSLTDVADSRSTARFQGPRQMVMPSSGCFITANTGHWYSRPG